ncbi:MAG: polyprenyl synthetase family protein [Chlamydiota bacterium]
MPNQQIEPDESLIKPLKEDFELFLKRNIIRLGDRNILRNACEYALLNGGKRIRPLIVMMVAKALGNHLDVSEACLSVEYFHTASLIADDLPCMDNDDYRRSKLALHKRFGETIALLASYTLISAGYEKIFRSVRTLSMQKEPFKNRADEACVIALHEATRCSGISGATGGQFQDLYSQERTVDEAFDIIRKKTISLFEISFAFGWIFGGGAIDRLDKTRELAYHFGMTFQILDDLGDTDRDGEKSLNIVHLVGIKEAKEIFTREMEMFSLKMKKLGLFTPEFRQTTDLLKHYAEASSS